MEQIEEEKQQIQNKNQNQSEQINQNQKQEENIADFKFDIDEIINKSYNYPQKDMRHHRISIAPMLDVTNPHWRFLFRLISRQTTLYTEMIHANSLEHIRHTPRVQFSPCEHPVVFQLGGCDPKLLQEASKIVEEMGYDEVNLNCGCPSAKVQCGSFGCCLMKEPELVGECMKSIRDGVQIPVTVKHRIGVDDIETFDFTYNFIKTVHEMSGVTHFQAHARKAYLKGLNPAQNRNVPPLNYDRVIELKKAFPDLDISINGGFKTYQQVHEILKPENKLLGCMIGRWAQESMFDLCDIDRQFYGVENPGYNRKEILQIYGAYGDKQLLQYPELNIQKLVFPLLNLFSGERSSGVYRRFLSQGAHNIKKKYNKFSDFIDAAIKDYEPYNKEAMEKRPPKNDEQAIDMMIKMKERQEHVQKSIQNNPSGKKKIKASKYQQKMEAKVDKINQKKEMEKKMQNNEQQENQIQSEQDIQNQEQKEQQQQQHNEQIKNGDNQEVTA
ncbi:hypothetical protein PPERSA_00599 [Pseudocohnilembus persalinus]|uniref:DUS-like FMN-binding domain-containing protein n=1 Tax=Pseudocohnilembus persalinus TaxID=266149 RepID=A0A0V0QSK7_PSEPJ|nr:hypothetical protein PPERSA_00599 [Pseudocohnilembus persalinus]|eukprot:KRX05298.1 hypothetical protein PPERSA_00599 [Pseudocohnilembus persalinus]